MKFVRHTALALFLSLASFATAKTFDDFNFEQERMFCSEDLIYIISSFDDSDKITAYSYAGDRLWDRTFFAKITSWQVIDYRILVFSKHRQGYQTYLTNLDRFSGEMIWQRP